MDISFSEQDLQFQEEIRAALANDYPAHVREKQEQGMVLSKQDMIDFHKFLYEKNWAGYNWPVEFGGTGWSPVQIYLFLNELALAQCPTILPFGVSMVGPVIYTFGNQEQKDRFLPDILQFNSWWCQGYSEPGSGSDLASLQCKAEDKGDHYLVNGTKIWTTMAQHADMIFCLVRTSKTEKPQSGISFLLIDMKSEGIDVRPLITLDQSPEPYQEVNQVFFEDVKVPKENLVGEENKGWTYAKYLLEFERGNSYSPTLYRGIEKLKAIAKETSIGNGTNLIDDSDFLNKLNKCEIEIQALEFVELRIFSALSAGQRVGPESSILKTRGTELQQKLQELSVEAIGYWASPFVYDTFANINEPSIGPDYAMTIAPVSYTHLTLPTILLV